MRKKPEHVVYGLHVKEVRDGLDLTQVALAKKLDVNYKTLQNVEAGRQTFSRKVRDRLERLAAGRDGMEVHESSTYGSGDADVGTSLVRTIAELMEAPNRDKVLTMVMQALGCSRREAQEIWIRRELERKGML